MAGGWVSITTEEDGRYCGAGTLENGGDVEEFAQQAYGMIVFLAEQLANATGTDRGAAIERAERNWRTGMLLGGRADGLET